MRIHRFVFFSAFLSLIPATGVYAQTTTTFSSANGTVTTTDPQNGTTFKASQYPIPVTVSGVTGTITKVTVKLNDIVSTRFGFQSAILLQGPGGQTLSLWAHACAGGGANGNFPGGDYTFDDAGSNVLVQASPATCNTVAQGSYQPVTRDQTDSYPAPGPGTTYNRPINQGTSTLTATNGVFTGLSGTNVNGTWNIYWIGFSSGATSAGGGTMGGAAVPPVQITITYLAATGTTTTVTTSGSPSTSGAAVTFTATVSPNAGANGSVTFSDSAGAIACSGGNTKALSGSQAACVASLTGEGIHTITASYGGGGGFGPSNGTVNQAVNNATSHTAATTTWCNTGTITIPKTSTVNAQTSPDPANPYPSIITVGGADSTGLVNSVTVSLNNITHNSPQFIGLMLVGPNGKAFDMFSFAGGGVQTTNTSVVLDDNGATALPQGSALVNNTHYKTASYAANQPTAYCTSASCNGVVVSEPAPSVFDSALPFGSKNLGDEFAGGAASGTWKLFAVNRATGLTGTIGGWCLNFTLGTGTPSTTDLVTNDETATIGQTVTFTATVRNANTSALLTTGTVTFTVDGSTTIASNVAVVNGVATATTAALTEGTHSVTAHYNGTASFGVSSATIRQRVDNNSTLTINGAVYTYCNTPASGNGITIPAGGAANPLVAPAGPYPSNVFATLLPGTTQKVTVKLNGYTQNIDGLQSLLLGPNGANLDFFSRTGGVPPAGTVGPFDLLFDDAAASLVPDPQNANALATGSWKPTSLSALNNWPACPLNINCNTPTPLGPPAPSSITYAATAGTGLLGSSTAIGQFGKGTASTFTGNGTWSLFMANNRAGAFGSVGSWCVNLTENLPDISLTQTPMTHSPATFKRGQSGSITVTASNLGPGPTGAPTLTITNALPIGLTFTTATGTGWSCSVTSGTPATGQTVTCTNPTPIVAGNNSAYTVNFTVGNATADSINISASITAGTGGDNPTTTANNTTTSGSITVAGTILTIDKSHTGNFTQGQVGATYTITIHNSGALNTNTGPGLTIGTLRVTDALPNVFTLTGVNGGAAWTCQPPASGVDCTLNSALAVGATSAGIVLTLNVSATAGSSVTNSGVLTADTDQIGTNPVQDDDTTTIIQNTTTTAADKTATFNTANQNVTLTATVTSNNLTVNAGTVTFTVFDSGNVQVGVAAVSGTVTAGAASATFVLPGNTNAGAYSIHAAYSGGGVFAASNDNTHTLTVNAASTTTTAQNATAPFSASNQSVNLSATITSGGGVVSGGTVTFTVFAAGNVQVGSPVVSGTVAAGAASATFTLPGGTAAGAYTIQAAYGGTTNFSANTGTGTLTVLSPPSLTKSFTPSTIAVNGTSSLTFTVTNPNAVALTGVAFTDSLPTNLTAPNGVTSVCGGASNLSVAANIIALAATTITGPTCTFSVTVTGTASGVYTNTTGAITSTNGGTGGTATANLTVASPPTISKTFGAATIPLNGTTTLSITVTNPNTGSLTLNGVGFTDNLPAGLVVGNPPGLANNTCSTTPTAVADAISVSLAGAVLNAGASCSFVVNVRGATAGAKNNSVQATSTEGGTGTAGLASLTVVTPPTISKSFGVSSMALNGNTTLNITVTNPNPSTTLTGISFTDTLPPNLAIANPNGLTAGCQSVGGSVSAAGTVTATQGTTSVSLSGLGLNTTAPQSCTFSVNVVATSAGSGSNIIPTVTSNEGGAGGPSNTAVLQVVGPPSIAKSFNPTTINVNATTTLTFTVTNPNGVGVNLTGVNFTDSLPVGLTVPAGTSSVCGGTNNLTIAANVITLGPTTIGNTPCTFSVTVTGAVGGAYTNTTGTVGSTNGGPGNTAMAGLNVGAAPSISKSFGAATIPINATTTLSFTVTNPNPAGGVALTGVGFTDTLPAGLIVGSPSGLTGNTCSTTPTAVAGSGTISLSGAVLNAGASCGFTVNVQGATAGQKNNSVQATSNEGGTGAAGLASLVVGGPPTLIKTFGANSIPLSGTTTLSFTVTNPNTAATLNGIGFLDTLPANLVVATPNGLTAGCQSIGGTVSTAGTVTAVAGSNTITLTGLGLNTTASRSCTFSVNITGSSAGTANNTVAVITSTEGGNGGPSNTATLQVVAPPSLLKSFNPTTINLGGTSTLAFTVTNPNGAAVPLTGVAFTDQISAGLTVPNAVASVCGGTNNLTIAANLITLSGATINGSPCTFAVTVTGVVANSYTNTTSAITSTNGGSGQAATAGLSVSPQTDLQVLSKGVSPVGPNVANTNVTYTIQIKNNGPNIANSVVLTDALPAGLTYVSCSAPGATSCGAVGNTVTASYASLAVSSTATIQIVAKINCDVANNATITNIASVASATQESNGANNSAMVSFTAKNNPPVITPTVTTSSLWPPTHDLINVGLQVTATSGTCPAPTSFTVQVFGNEDDETPTAPEEINSPDAKNIAVATLRLRSERVEAGNGRVYLIVVTGTNAGGSAGFGTAVVVVRHDTSKKGNAAASMAAAAKAYADSHNGAPPPGYFLLGDGAIIGPKQ